jgi:single-strand selective monofunctional uracil DNA glycosylase
MVLLESADRLTRRLQRVRFAPPVAYVYNPLRYARAAYAAYVERFGQSRRQVVLLGMNPGPWGMAQTGVPFGEVGSVRGWLEIDVVIKRPRREHPKRPVLGLACTRSEVSGARLWGWARDTFTTPEQFFKRFFVANYCPLAFLEESGRNRTPDKLPAEERRRLEAACDDALRELIAHLQPEILVGIGQFAEARARAVFGARGLRIGRILHPSPASPLANRDWAGQAGAQLQAMGIRLP